MMKVVSAAVDWMEEWANAPHFVIRVDLLPDRDALRYQRFGESFIAEHEGYVAKINKADVTKPDQGFGGARQRLTMADGSTVEFIGGWHAATAYTWNHPEWGSAIKPFTECTWKERDGRFPNLGYSAWITLELLQQAINDFLPGVEIYQGDYNFYPKQVGVPPKIPRKQEGGDVRLYWPLSAEQMGA
jgi:hypothetical protein